MRTDHPTGLPKDKAFPLGIVCMQATQNTAFLIGKDPGNVLKGSVHVTVSKPVISRIYIAVPDTLRNTEGAKLLFRLKSIVYFICFQTTSLF